ncbi:MAG: monovalent cation/H(+) antiporter subunit G [Rhodocyclaceae bacterium]
MNGSLLPWLASLLVLAGGVFCLLGAIGVLRLPDCYSRMHAASKAGALGAVLVLAGVAAASSGAAAMEALFALMAVLVTAPLAAHAISRAAYAADIKPVVGRLGNVIEEEEVREQARDGAGLPDAAPAAREAAAHEVTAREAAAGGSPDRG